MSRSDRFADADFETAPRKYYEPHPLGNIGVPSNFQVIRQLLTTEKNCNRLYGVIWQRAEQEYNRKKCELSSDHFDSTIPKECYIAVTAYTLDDVVEINCQPLKLFLDFNRRFRTLTDKRSWDSFPYKSFYYLLVMVRPGIKNKPQYNRTLFRGLRNFRFHEAPKIGNNFFFDHFASSSSDRQIARGFVGHVGTLIELKDGTKVAMGITDYSYYQGEDEVLVFPCNGYRVVDFKKGTWIDTLVLELAPEKSVARIVLEVVMDGFLNGLTFGFAAPVLRTVFQSKNS